MDLQELGGAGEEPAGIHRVDLNHRRSVHVHRGIDGDRSTRRGSTQPGKECDRESGLHGLHGFVILRAVRLGAADHPHAGGGGVDAFLPFRKLALPAGRHHHDGLPAEIQPGDRVQGVEVGPHDIAEVSRREGGDVLKLIHRSATEPLPCFHIHGQTSRHVHQHQRIEMDAGLDADLVGLPVDGNGVLGRVCHGSATVWRRKASARPAAVRSRASHNPGLGHLPRAERAPARRVR